MRSSNVQGFASKMLTLYEEEEEGLSFVSWLWAHAQFNFYSSLLCSAMYYIALLLTVAKKRVCAAVAHKSMLFIRLVKIDTLLLSIDFSFGRIFRKSYFYTRPLGGDLLNFFTCCRNV